VPEFLFFILGWIPLILSIVALFLLKRLADGVNDVAGALRRGLLAIEEAIDGAGDDEIRWPEEPPPHGVE
jgi:hypothetical protein